MKRIPVSNRELGGENGLVMTYLIEMGLVGENSFHPRHRISCIVQAKGSIREILKCRFLSKNF